MDCGNDSSDDESLHEIGDVLPAIFTTKENGHNIEVPKQRRLSVKEMKIKRSEIGNGNYQFSKHDRIKALWRSAFVRLSQQKDPWEKFHLVDLPVENARRYRYNALKCTWVEDIVRVKFEHTSFNHGAMRKCFRVKKLSNFAHSDDWSHALNFVAKCYKEKVERDVYFEDVRLQMAAKLWGEEYNREPAICRKVDVAQMCVLEFIDRPNKPLFHLEHYIEGNYRKYNSNSGFVDDVMRNTPQAFSHFTFERSGHRLIVVDIQGVGDLWTDPQIHTFDGQSYGDGNLGLKGMALFFHTHRCNPICRALELSTFDLPSNKNLTTLANHCVGMDDGLLDADPIIKFGETIANVRPRRRYLSGNISSDTKFEPRSLPSPDPTFLPKSVVFNMATSVESNTLVNQHSNNNINNDNNNDMLSDHSQFDNSLVDIVFNRGISQDSGIFPDQYTPNHNNNNHDFIKLPRQRTNTNDSSLTDYSDIKFDEYINRESELREFFRLHQHGHRSSSVAALRGVDAVILGLIHHELACLHACGRLLILQHSVSQSKCGTSRNDSYPTKSIPWDAVIFHEEQAASLNSIDAIICLAQYYLNLPIDGPLSDCPIKPDSDDAGIVGITYVSTAASNGDRSAMLYLAESNYNGKITQLATNSSCDSQLKPDWLAAVHWYEIAAKTLDFNDDPIHDNYDDENDMHRTARQRASFMSLVDWPVYRVNARLAEMFTKGGYGLKQDRAKAYELYSSAANGANEALQGRLAMKYYEQAALLEDFLEE